MITAPTIMSCSDNCIFSVVSRCQKDSKSDQKVFENGQK